MEKKLYRVKVTMYVMAENESDACAAATQARFDIFECTARRPEYIEAGWEDAIPYNSSDMLTCAEIFTSQQKVVHPTPLQLPETRRWQSGGPASSNYMEAQANPG